MSKKNSVDIHTKALREAMPLSNVKTIARKYNISEDIIRRKYKIVLFFLPIMVWLSPKKNTIGHRIISQIKIFLFMSAMRVYRYFKERKDNSR